MIASNKFYKKAASSIRAALGIQRLLMCSSSLEI